MLFKRLLEKLGCRGEIVDCSKNGIDAVNMLHASPFANLPTNMSKTTRFPPIDPNSESSKKFDLVFMVGIWFFAKQGRPLVVCNNEVTFTGPVHAGNQWV